MFSNLPHIEAHIIPGGGYVGRVVPPQELEEYDEVIIIRRRRRKASSPLPMPIPPYPFPDPLPNPFPGPCPTPNPWPGRLPPPQIPPYPNTPDIIWNRDDEPCMIEEFFRRHPPGTPCMIACPCPRHRVLCS